MSFLHLHNFDLISFLQLSVFILQEFEFNIFGIDLLG
jgi:hypothetical protein